MREHPTMIRQISIAAGLCLFAAILAAADAPRTVTIRWHGQSFFEIESSKGTRIAIDPHAIEGYGRTNVAADLILISHEHNDHNQAEVIRNHERAKIIHGLKGAGNRAVWNPVDETFRDVHIRTVGTYHDPVEGMQRGKNTVFIIEVDGLHIVHLGDLGHLLTPKQVREIGPVDVLMIPVGGVYTIYGDEAKKVVEQLKPRQYVLPMHYGTKAFEDLLPIDVFLEDQTNVKKYLSNKISVDSNFKPAEPVTAVLDWKN
jgi:L-ascorbate metabolism protein UlaG (beta-lactamase superfamily)